MGIEPHTSSSLEAFDSNSRVRAWVWRRPLQRVPLSAHGVGPKAPSPDPDSIHVGVDRSPPMKRSTIELPPSRDVDRCLGGGIGVVGFAPTASASQTRRSAAELHPETLKGPAGSRTLFSAVAARRLTLWLQTRDGWRRNCTPCAVTHEIASNETRRACPVHHPGLPTQELHPEPFG
jgi:hypothetical protein